MDIKKLINTLDTIKSKSDSQIGFMEVKVMLNSVELDMYFHVAKDVFVELTKTLGEFRNHPEFSVQIDICIKDYMANVWPIYEYLKDNEPDRTLVLDLLKKVSSACELYMDKVS